MFAFDFFIIFFSLTVSPAKDYGARSSEQLNTLRTLLEKRLHEQDDLSILQSSPGTFTKDFLQSYKYKNHSKEFISDLDDDEDNNERFLINREKYQSDALSSSSTTTSMTDDINQDKKIYSNPINLSTSNYTPKIDRRK